MNTDLILQVFNWHQVRYILFGGMNFLLRHAPILTYDVDFWIEDTPENRQRCEQALAELDAEWGGGDDNWTLTSRLPAGWLEGQAVFCLICPAGAIDIFRYVRGLDDWQSSFQGCVKELTKSGVPYHGMSDVDMLRCQYALDEPFRKKDRVTILEAKLKASSSQP